MAKKQLTTAQQKSKYRTIQRTTFAGEFVSVGSPYIIMGAINFDEWFNTADGWKIGLGGSLAMALMCIVVFSITKKKTDTDQKTGGYITLLLGWLAVAFICTLLANIMYQIGTIMFMGAIGIAGALGLEITSKKYKGLADDLDNAMKKAKADMLQEQARKELENESAENKTVKIKVKK